MHGLRLVNLVEDGGERRGLAAAGGAGHEDEAVFLPRHVIENLAEAERMNRRHLALRLSHDDGKRAALLENIDAKARAVGELIAAIAGAALEQVAEQMALGADDVQGDLLRLERREMLDLRVDHGFLEHAVAFHLERPPDGKHQVGDPRVGIEHRAQDCIEFGISHGKKESPSPSSSPSASRLQRGGEEEEEGD